MRGMDLHWIHGYTLDRDPRACGGPGDAEPSATVARVPLGEKVDSRAVIARPAPP